MFFSTSYSALQRRFWCLLGMFAVVLVVFMTFSAPNLASAAGLHRGASGAAIADLTGRSSAEATGDLLDGGLVQHAHCMCHLTARVSFKTLPFRRLMSDARLPLEANLSLSHALLSLPFKPPRSAP